MTWRPWVVLMGISGIGCEAADVIHPPEPPNPPNEGVMAISVAPNNHVISVGDTLRFRATWFGRGITGVRWKLEPTSVGTVDADGLVSGVQPGTTGVFACAKERPEVCGVAVLWIQ